MFPRIYTYKITFLNTPFYYYGVHKEKKYDEKYFGTPKTNKWYWDFYEYEKQILEVFNYTDEGWEEAQEVEKRLIKPFLNDEFCLNESVGGKSSIEICRKIGLYTKENKKGIFSLSKEQLQEIGKKRGKENYEKGLGIASLTKEQRSEIGIRSGKKNYENGIGLASISKERRSEISRSAVEKNKENKVGIFALTKEQMSENGRKNGLKMKENKTGFFKMSLEEKQEVCKKVNRQKWMCIESGYITTSGPLTIYQRSKGIDTSKRIRVE
jgi:general stress protein YciG